MNVIQRAIRKLSPRRASQTSYAQCGEDLIMTFALDQMGVTQARYLDIGAYDPVFLSNTWLFYRRGGSGVCVEPNPAYWQKLVRRRPRDICLNAGVGEMPQPDAELFVLNSNTLATFSRAQADELAAKGWETLSHTVRCPVVAVNDLLGQHFSAGIDILSLDVEGMELVILRSLDFGRFRPRIICVETLTYAPDTSGHKIEETVHFVKGQGYFLYADTHVNSIFVESAAWSRGNVKKGASRSAGSRA